MKRIITTTLFSLLSVLGTLAQNYPLMNARKALLETRGIKVVSEITQKQTDANDSTCRLEVISFEIPAKKADIFNKITSDYKLEASLSDGGHSFVCDLGMTADQRNALPGIKKVKYYYFQNRPYIQTGDGHNFVSVRKQLDHPFYRKVTCIEWWPEDTLGVDGDKLKFGKVAGRIICINGPMGEKAYMRDTKPVKQEESAECFVALQEIKELVRMYSLRESVSQKEAVISSINDRIIKIVSSVGHKDHKKHVKEMLSALSDLPFYKCDVLFPESSNFSNIHCISIDSALSFDIDRVRFFAGNDPVSARYGKESANGLFIINVKTIKYDASAPPLKVPYLAKPSNNYNPLNYKTFPVYTGFSTIPFPPEDEEDEGFGKCALWCTADSTYLVTYSRVRSNAHYWHHIHDDKTLRDRFTGKEYPLRSIWGVPVDTTYFISGHTNDIVCFVSVYDALPPTATSIDILKKDGNVPTPKGGTGWAPGKSYYDVSVADLQKNQQKIIGKPWILNRPDKVRRYIVDGNVATPEDARGVSEINTIKLCNDGQLFIFSKYADGIKTVPYYFLSFEDPRSLTILVKMLPEGAKADASYSLEDISKMLAISKYSYVNLDILESDCKMREVDKIRSFFREYHKVPYLFFQCKTFGENHYSIGGYDTLCPGHEVVTHTVHLDARNHFILDGEDIVPRTLYSRVLKIIQNEGDTSLCVFKISCEPESSFNYYSQVVKNMQRVKQESFMLTLRKYFNLKPLDPFNYHIIENMTPMRVVDAAYHPNPVNDNPFNPRGVFENISITVDGTHHPELKDINNLLKYVERNSLLIDKMEYKLNGKPYGQNTASSDYLKGKFELNVTTSPRPKESK